MIYKKITELIGHTPILEIPLKKSGSKLLLKLEKFNPGQSMKDRMALSMIQEAERTGKLKPGGIIVESTSGNTGIGLAMIAAEKGYKFIAVVDHHAAKEKILIMQALGAQIYYVDEGSCKGQLATGVRETMARNLSKKLGAFWPEQADNPFNAKGYEDTLAIELWKETENTIDVFIGAVGTGGSLCGTSKKLKELNPQIKVIGVEPDGSIIFGGMGRNYYQSGTGTPLGVEIGDNVKYELIDTGLKVSDAEAFNTARYLAKNYGLLVGGSAGGVIYKALEFIDQQDTSIQVIALVGDGGEKYLDTIFNDLWMKEFNLLSLKIEDRLSTWL